MLAGWGTHMVNVAGPAHLDRRGNRQLDFLAIPAGTSQDWALRPQRHRGLSDHVLLHAKRVVSRGGRTQRPGPRRRC
eukprot:11167566-Lingulodinium_polyedra.AAC.1